MTILQAVAAGLENTEKRKEPKKAQKALIQPLTLKVTTFSQPS